MSVSAEYLKSVRLGCAWTETTIQHPTAIKVSAERVPQFWARGMQPRLCGDNTIAPDCVQVACGNLLQNFMAYEPDATEQNFEPVPLDVMLNAYRAVNHADPFAPDAPGTLPPAMFDYLARTPFHGYLLDDLVTINPRSELQVRSAIERYKGIFTVVRLSDGQQQPGPWVQASGGLWGYHAVCVDEFNRSTTYGTSWGARQAVEQSFFDEGDVQAAYGLVWRKAA